MGVRTHGVRTGYGVRTRIFTFFPVHLLNLHIFAPRVRKVVTE